jgi:hypothetical protein
MNLKPNIFQLPVTPLDPKFKPVVTTVQPQSDGSYYVSLLFAKPALLKVKIEKGNVIEAKDQEIEKSFDQDFLGITGGLRGNRTGDTAFATLHRGGSSLFGIFKKAPAALSTEELFMDLANNGNALGFSYKHSFVQIIDGKFQVRSSKESGALLDAALIGDYIFGLTGGVIYREPYLNSEKRYFLREDLEPNFRFHKVEDGVFWLLGAEDRLMKLGLTDKKAMPTTKKLPSSPFRASADCSVDSWLYGIAGDTFFRVRVNPENRLDELQTIKKFEGPLPLSLASQSFDSRDKGHVWLSAQENSSSSLYVLKTESQEDPEFLPEVPLLEKVFASDDYTELSNLSVKADELLVASCRLKEGAAALWTAKI